MKTVIPFLTVCFCTLLIMSSCNKESSQNDSGTVQFSFGGTLKSVSVDSSQKPPITVLTAAIVTIVNEQNQVVFESKKIKIYGMGVGYISESLSLPVGKYQLTRFAVLDSVEVKYACPVAGSERAQLVSQPLPIVFSVTANSTVNITPEVLLVYGFSPAQFGYAAFTVRITPTYFLKIKVNSLDSINHDTISVPASLVVGMVPCQICSSMKSIKYLLKAGINDVEVNTAYSYYFYVTKGTIKVNKILLFSDLEKYKKQPLTFFIP